MKRIRSGVLAPLFTASFLAACPFAWLFEDIGAESFSERDFSDGGFYEEKGTGEGEGEGTGESSSKFGGALNVGLVGLAMVVDRDVRCVVSALGGGGRFASREEVGRRVARQRKHSPVPK